MNKNTKIALSTLVAAFLAFISSAAIAQNPQDEVNKQIAKLISDAISTRVSTRALEAAAPGQRPAAAEQNTLWGSYTRLRVDFTGGESRTNVYVAGYDRDITANLLAGMSVNYSDTGGSIFVPALRFDAHSKGVSPFLTYMFTKSIFGTLSVNYNESSAAGIRTESYGAGAELGGVYRTGDLVAKGRAGIANTRSDSGAVGGKDSTTSYTGDGELGYYFTPSVYGLVGIGLSDTDSPNGYNASARIGLEMNINRTTALSFKYEKKIDDSLPAGFSAKVDSFTVGLKVRF